jgi:hypothetical protein
VGRVLGPRLRIDGRRLPLPAVPVALQSAQQAEAIVGDGVGPRPRVDRAIGGDGHRQARRRHACQSGQPVGAGDRAERVPIGVGGDADRSRGDRTRLLAAAREQRVVIARLAKGGDGAEVVLDGAKQIGAIQPSLQRAIRVFVIAQRPIGHTGDRPRPQAERACHLGAAAAAGRVADRLDVKDAGGRQGHAVLAHGGRGRDDRERSPGTRGRTAVEGGVVKPRGVGHLSAMVLAGGVVALAGQQAAVAGVRAENRQARAVLQSLAGLHIDRPLAITRAFRAAQLRLDAQAAKLGVEHGVDHARDGVRAVDGGGAVEQNLDPLHACHREGVGVGGLDRHQVLGLGARMQHGAAAVQQRQGVAGAQAAQVQRRDVAPRVIEVAGGAGLMELHVAGLRDRAIELVARHRPRGDDVVLVDDGHRQSAGAARRALDLRAHHHDGLDHGGRLIDLTNHRRLDLGARDHRAQGDGAAVVGGDLQTGGGDKSGQGVAVGEIADHGRGSAPRGGLERKQHLLARLPGEGLQGQHRVLGGDVEAVLAALRQRRTRDRQGGGGGQDKSPDASQTRHGISRAR